MKPQSNNQVSQPQGGKLQKEENPVKHFFERFSSAVTHGAGKPAAFVSAFIVVVIWAVSGPFFKFSETWQLVINTGTTIITFLMVFLIQQAQNKDTVALHLKLNELIAANRRASNRLINIEDMNEDELVNLKNFFVTLSSDGIKDEDLFTQHSIDEGKLRETAEDIAEQLHGQIDSKNPGKDDETDIQIDKTKPGEQKS